MPKGSPAKAAIASHIQGEPQGIADLVDAMRTDYQVTLGDLAIKANAQTAKVSFTPATDDPREAALASELESLWWQKFGTMLESQAYGRVAYEKVIGYDPEHAINTVALNELPHRYTEMRLTPDGDFDGIDIHEKGRKKPIPLPPEYSWWLAIDATPTQPHGKSRYLGAPQQLWKDKRHITCLLGTFVKRFVLGLGKVHGPESYPNPDDPSNPFDGAAVFASASTSVENGGHLYLSNNRIPTADGNPGPYEIDVESFGVTVTDAKPITDVILHYDMAQLLARGIAPKLVMENTAGSLALVSQQMLIFMAVIDELVGQPANSFQKYVVDKVVQLNDPSGKWKITVNFTPLTQRPDDLAETLVRAWLTSESLSPLILSGAVDVVPILESVGLTISEGAAQKLQKWIDANAAAEQVRARAPEPIAMDLKSPYDGFLDRLWPGESK